MQCPKCKAQIDEYSRFCPSCGASMIIPENVDEATVSASAPQTPLPQTAWEEEAPTESLYQYNNRQQNPPVHEPVRQPIQQPNAPYPNQMPVYPGTPYAAQPAAYGQTVAVKKKSKAPLIIAIVAAVFVLAIGGFAALIIVNTIGNGSSDVVDRFTAAINQEDLTIITQDVFAEDRYLLTGYTFSGIRDDLANGGLVGSRITSVKTTSGGANFDGYRSKVYEHFPSVGSPAAVTERSVLTVEFYAVAAPDGAVKTYYFDLAKVNGEWKIASLTQDQSSLYAF